MLKLIYAAFITVFSLTSCSLFQIIGHTNPNDPDNPTRLYTIKYYPNGATGSVPVDSHIYAVGETAIIKNSGSLLKNGYSFAGWTTSTNNTSSSFAAGASNTMSAADIALFAVWITNSLTFSSSKNEIVITGGSIDSSGSLVVPYGVTGIGYCAFWYHNDLRNVVLSQSVTSIAIQAFMSCSFLSNISIPYGLTSIDQCAFYGCTNLFQLLLPSSISIIIDRAFYGCNNLTNITFIGANCDFQYWTSIFPNNTNFTIHAPAGGTVQAFCVAHGIFFY